MEEIWVDINGFEGLYKISNIGNVKSLNHNRKGREKIIKGRTFKNGYRNVCLCSDGFQDNIYVHRLVADHFVKKSDNDWEMGRDVVYFIDGDSSNLHYTNLKWMTREEVVDENIRLGRHITTTTSRRYLAPKQVTEIKTLLTKKRLRNVDIANLYGISKESVSQIKTGKRRLTI
jgi:predicted XRE-type DNA-binding protein